MSSRKSIGVSLFLMAGLLVSLTFQIHPGVNAGYEQGVPPLNPTDQPVYILLFIGDGMGSEHRKAARWVEYGLDGELVMDQFPVQGWSETASADNPITDSAAGATAIATGHKTNNRMIAVSPDLIPLKTVLEYAQEQGLSTGLVTTVQISHATPASFGAHTESRSNMEDIAAQLLEKNINVLFGGGENQFLPPEESGCFPQPGERTDGRNLISEAQGNGYTTICSAAELLNLEPDSETHVLGLFGDEEMQRAFNPSLQQMTQTAIDILNNDPDGFFLMVEGGQIDWASHNNDAENAIQDTIDFDHAVSVGKEYFNTHPNSMMVVTADHETGGMSLHFDSDPESNQDGPFTSADGTPFYVRWSTTGHTAANVPITADGPGSHLLNETVPNTTIFWAITWLLFYHQYLPLIGK